MEKKKLDVEVFAVKGAVEGYRVYFAGLPQLVYWCDKPLDMELFKDIRERKDVTIVPLYRCDAPAQPALTDEELADCGLLSEIDEAGTVAVEPPDAEGWKEALKAWMVCASIHREYAKGKDPFFTTRQADFVKHEADARTHFMKDYIELVARLRNWNSPLVSNDLFKEAADAIEAQQKANLSHSASGKPDSCAPGWKVVPPRPTQAMCDAFNSGIPHLTFGDCYVRMLEDAPTGPQIDAETGKIDGQINE